MGVNIGQGLYRAGAFASLVRDVGASVFVVSGIKPTFEPFIGNDRDVLAYVVSVNLRRRHLSESQRAMVAATMANLKPQDTLKQGSRDANLRSGEKPPVTQTEAAEMMNSSQRNVCKAKKVQREASPELQQSVRDGKVTVNAAEQAAGNPEAEQRLIENPNVVSTSRGVRRWGLGRCWKSWKGRRQKAE